MSSDEDTNACEYCGARVSCQGSDSQYRYHHESPRHKIASAMTQVTDEDFDALVLSVREWRSHV